MTAISLLVISRYGEYREIFKRFSDITFAYAANTDEAEKIINESDTLFNVYFGEPYMIAPLLKRIGVRKELKWIQSTFAGVDMYCKNDMPRGYVLTKMVDIYAPIMSEYVFAYAFAHFRHLKVMEENQKIKKWDMIPYGFISWRSILILGTGSIGEGIAKAANAFGMGKIWGYNTNCRQVPNFTEMIPTERLNEYIAKADIIVNLLPATDLTKNFLNKERLSCVNEKAILILSGRGTTYDAEALQEFVKQGKIRRTVIDVFEVEPLPENSAFWSLPGVTVTPHIAATILPEVVVTVFAENAERFKQGKPLKGIVDFERGY